MLDWSIAGSIVSLPRWVGPGLPHSEPGIVATSAEPPGQPLIHTDPQSTHDAGTQQFQHASRRADRAPATPAQLRADVTGTIAAAWSPSSRTAGPARTGKARRAGAGMRACSYHASPGRSKV